MKAIVITIIFFLTINSAVRGQNTTHEAAAKYYQVLMDQTIDIFSKLTRLGNYLGQYNEIALKCENFKLDKERFDTINNLFSECSIMLNKGVFGIIALKEVDTAINLKMDVLNIYKGFNTVLGTYFPQFLSAFKNGFQKDHREAMVNLKNHYSNYLDQLVLENAKIDILDKSINLFLVKYNLSEYEILQKSQ